MGVGWGERGWLDGLLLRPGGSGVSAGAAQKRPHQNHETSPAVDRDGFHERQFATPRSL